MKILLWLKQRTSIKYKVIKLNKICKERKNIIKFFIEWLLEVDKQIYHQKKIKIKIKINF